MKPTPLVVGSSLIRLYTTFFLIRSYILTNEVINLVDVDINEFIKSRKHEIEESD